MVIMRFRLEGMPVTPANDNYPSPRYLVEGNVTTSLTMTVTTHRI